MMTIVTTKKVSKTKISNKIINMENFPNFPPAFCLF